MNTIEPAHLIFLRAVTLANARSLNEQQLHSSSHPQWLATRFSRAVSAAHRWNAITAPIRRMAEDTGIPVRELLQSL